MPSPITTAAALSALTSALTLAKSALARSTAKSGTTTTTASKTTTTTGGGSRTTGRTSWPSYVNTSGLTGVAKTFAEAYNKAISQGASVSQALAAAEKAAFGKTIGIPTTTTTSAALSSLASSLGGGGGGASTTRTATPTTVVLPSGQQTTGYLIGGYAYLDPGGTQRIPVGSYVQAGGSWWQLTPSGGVKVSGPPATGGTAGGGGSPTTQQTTLRSWLQTTAPTATIRTQGNTVIISIPGVGEKTFTYGTIPGTTFSATEGTHYVTNPAALAQALGLGVLGTSTPAAKPVGSGSSLRDWASAKGITIDYNAQTGVVTLSNPNVKTAQGTPVKVQFVAGDPVALSQLGLEFRDGTHIVKEPAKLASYLGVEEEEEEQELTPQEMLNQLIAWQWQQPPITTQELPPYAPYEEPQIQPITWEEALKQARQIVEPQIEAAREQLLETYRQQRELLPYQLAARGQLEGGLLEGGYEALTQAQARALNELQLQQLAQLAQLAQAIREGDVRRVADELNRRFQQWLQLRNLELQRWGALTSTQLQAEQANRARVAQLLNALLWQLTFASDIEKQAVADAILRAYNTWLATGEMPDFSGVLGTVGTNR